MEVHLYGKLRRFSNILDPRQESVVHVQVKEGDTIEDIINHIHIPWNEIGSNIFLNGEYSKVTRSVGEGDRLGLFPDDMQLLYRWHFVKKGG